MAVNSTVRDICYQWLEKAFRQGQKCPPHSDQASEYFLPLFYHNWSPTMTQELAEAEQKGGTT